MVQIETTPNTGCEVCVYIFVAPGYNLDAAAMYMQLQRTPINKHL